MPCGNVPESVSIAARTRLATSSALASGNWYTPIIATGRTTIKAMVPAMYAAVDPRLHPAAAHSVLAHLIHMTRSGEVASDGAPSLDSDYRLNA